MLHKDNMGNWLTVALYVGFFVIFTIALGLPHEMDLYTFVLGFLSCGFLTSLYGAVKFSILEKVGEVYEEN